MLHVFLSNRAGDVRYGTTGKPVEGYEIELRGEDGRPVADGEVGDLYIRGPSAALMYWGNREKSRETFQGGWTKSGDKYVRDADGYYTYSGRSDDMLKVSGIWVSPFEVEATLMQHPAVLECAVIGTEDAEGLTKTKAFVVVKPGAGGERRRPQGLRQGQARAPTSTRARSSSSTSCRRRPPARSSAFACASASAAARRRERPAAAREFARLALARRGRCALEYEWVGAPRAGAAAGRVPARGPRLDLDVEGLPARVLRARTASRGFVFSRYGYGHSTPQAARRALAARLHARSRRTRCCRRCSPRSASSRPWLFGHSDGGTIALLHAARSSGLPA